MSDQNREKSRFDLDAVSSPAAGANTPAGGIGRLGLGVPPDVLPATPPYAGYGTAAQNVAAHEIHLTDYLRIIYKRRWIAVTAFTLVFGIIMLRTFTATSLYTARAQLLIETEDQNVVKFEEVLTQNKATNDYYQTQYKILASRLLARRVLDVEHLWNDPMFAGQKTSGVSWNPMTWVSAFTSSRPTTPALANDIPASPETVAQSRILDAFLAGLSISPVRNSRLVDVLYESPNPAMSARLANAIAKQYIEQNLEFKFMATKDAADFLSARMSEQRKVLEQSETALQRYRESNDSVSLEDKQNIVVQRLADLNSAVTKARTERIQKEGAWEQIRSLQNDRAALDAHPLIISNSFIQQLKASLGELQRQEAQMAEKLGDRHPDMVKMRSAVQTTEAKLQTEVAKVVQSIRNDYEAAVAQERSLTVALDQQKNQALALSRQSIEYGVLQRDATSNQQLFEGLLQRVKETGIEGELKASNIRIVDMAEAPRVRSSPSLRNNALLGISGGLLLGLGLAFFFEYFDSRIKAPDEIKRYLGLSFLGMIPALDAKTLASGAPIVGAGAPHQFAEAFRALRTNVIFSSADAGSKSIVVTSTAPGEGKTVVSTNLAVTLAMGGQRVLLIDADMRRPKIHEMFAIQQEPGISNVMVGDAKASEAVKRSTVPNLWLMPAGKHPPNPAELLGSKRFRDFLASLGDHFDWVVLDTPPVMAVTDAAVVSHMVTGVVFVIGSEMTSRGAAKAALDQLDVAKANHIGGILNRVDLHRNAYYYSHYYHRSYGDYYSAVSSL